MANTGALRCAVIDGIAVPARYRERQLASLHKGLTSLRTELTQALKIAHGLTTAEATAELLLTLTAIKTYHATTGPRACLEDEYRTANGEDHEGRRTPFGYAYIVPAERGRLYSTIVPVAAAVGAGNVVLLQSVAVDALSTLLEQMLSKALSRETFGVVSEEPFDSNLQASYRIRFEGTCQPEAVSTSRSLKSPDLRAAAVVDRSGDFGAAARDLVQARFSFGGQSSYAPDIVLVNEFLIADFGKAVAQAGLQHLAQSGRGTSARNAKSNSNLGSDLPKLLESDATMLISGENGSVALLRNRDSQLRTSKIHAPLLLILPISSMDDAIDLLNSTDLPLMANYVYATPAAAKYISQFVRSHASFVNHLPTELMIGGPAPEGHTTLVHTRYTIDMFTKTSPIWSNNTPQSRVLATIAAQSSDTRSRRKAEAMLDVRLKPFAEPFGPRLGFFEQGLLMGAGLSLSSICVAAFFATKYGYSAVSSILRR